MLLLKKKKKKKKKKFSSLNFFALIMVYEDTNKLFQLGTGTGMGSTSSQGSVGSGLASENLSQHQAKLRAAATAASIYEKSYVYPSANTLVWYVPLCHDFNHLVYFHV
jgi:hypothetical protein